MTKFTNFYDQALVLADLSKLIYEIALLHNSLGNKWSEQEEYYFEDIRIMIEDNEDHLAKSQFKHNFIGKKTGMLTSDSFKRLEKIDINGRKIRDKRFYMTCTNFDYLQNEVAYAIWIDEIHENIIVVFRGTDSNIDAGTGCYNNLMTDLHVSKVGEDIPEPLRSNIGCRRIKIHEGFHSFLNRKTDCKTDWYETTIRDQILKEVKVEIRRYPNYKILTTGHSLGAALSTLTAYYFAITDKISSPICNIHFESPRLGDIKFLKLCQYLEKEGRLQVARFVCNYDLIAVAPLIDYCHVGFEIRMDRKKTKSIKCRHRTPDMAISKLLSLVWDNSIQANFDFRYDHGDYIERVINHQKEIKKMGTLDAMYGKLDW